MSRDGMPLGNRSIGRTAATAALALRLAVLLCLAVVGCTHEPVATDSWPKVVADLLHVNEGVAGALATIEVSGDADAHVPRLTSLAEQLEQLTKRTKKLANPTPAESKHVLDHFADPLREVHRRVQRMAIAIGPSPLEATAISKALDRLCEASAQESELLAARLGDQSGEIPWYAPLLFHDTLENLAADALKFKQDLALILVEVSDRLTANDAARDLEKKRPILEAYRSRQQQLGDLSAEAITRIREMPAQLKATAVVGAELQRISKAPEQWEAVRNPLARLADAGASNLFGNFRQWSSGTGPDTTRQRPMFALFSLALPRGIGWGSRYGSSGVDEFEPLVENACLQFGEYRVFVMRISRVSGTSPRVMANKLAEHMDRPGISADRHPSAYVAAWGGADYVVLAPVDDFHALLTSIDFGTFSSVDSENMTVQMALDRDRVDEFREPEPEPKSEPEPEPKSEPASD